MDKRQNGWVWLGHLVLALALAVSLLVPVAVPQVSSPSVARASPGAVRVEEGYEFDRPEGLRDRGGLEASIERGLSQLQGGDSSEPYIEGSSEGELKPTSSSDGQILCGYVGFVSWSHVQINGCDGIYYMIRFADHPNLYQQVADYSQKHIRLSGVIIEDYVDTTQVIGGFDTIEEIPGCSWCNVQFRGEVANVTSFIGGAKVEVEIDEILFDPEDRLDLGDMAVASGGFWPGGPQMDDVVEGDRVEVWGVYDGIELGKHQIGLESSGHYLKKILVNVLFEGEVTGFPNCPSGGFGIWGCVNVEIDIILSDPTGNLEIGHNASVSWPVLYPFDTIDVDVGDRVQVCGEYKDIEELPGGWSGFQEYWIELSTDDHWLIKIEEQCSIEIHFQRMCYEPGAIVTMTLEFRKDDVLTNPSSINATLYNSLTIPLDFQPTATTGVYQIDFATGGEGTWTLEVSADIGGCQAEASKSFLVLSDCGSFTGTCFNVTYDVHWDDRGDIPTNCTTYDYEEYYDIHKVGATCDYQDVYFLWETEMLPGQGPCRDFALWAWIDADDDPTTGNDEGYEYLVNFAMDPVALRSEWTGLFNATSTTQPPEKLHPLAENDYCILGSYLELRVPKWLVPAVVPVKVYMGVDANFFWTWENERICEDNVDPFYLDSGCFSLPVHNINTGEDFLTIQEAIDDSDTKNGHNITVDPGVYVENVVVDKGLNISSTLGASVTRVQAADNATDVFDVRANNVTISGFNISGTETLGAAGISLAWVKNCHIWNNDMNSNVYGIKFWYGSQNVIEKNTVRSNNNGLDILYSGDNEIRDNTIGPDNGYSFYIDYNSDGNRVFRNTIEGNAIGMAVWNSKDNQFYHNRFIDNSNYHARDGSTNNTWNLPRPVGGNYWSGHPCEDGDGDGFCDSPYQLPHSTVEDLLPLASETLPGKLVHNVDQAKDYYFIQEAVYEASANETIQVDAGIFDENVKIDKRGLTIESTSNASSTVVHALNPNDHVFWIMRGGVTIKGFTAQNATGTGKAGIYSWSGSCNVSDNVVRDNYAGIWLVYSAFNCAIKDNVVDSNDAGGVVVLGGDINRTVDNNLIEGNNVTDNGVWGGIYLAYAADNTIQDNVVTSNDMAGTNLGIRFQVETRGNKVTGNTISNLQYGLKFDDSTTTDNLVYRNNFINNEVQAFDGGNNTWNKLRPVGGNYWSGHPCQDDDGDGFCDDPYEVASGVWDFLPLASETLAEKPVHNIDQGKDYWFIQEAVDDADSGDTIQVDAGVFDENVAINKTLTIESTSNASSTVVEALDPADHVFKITADYVTISGFTLQGAGLSPYAWRRAGIRIEGVEGCWICGNEARDNGLGIFLIGVVNCSVRDNEVTGNSFGIEVEDSDSNEGVENCTILGNQVRDNNVGISLTGLENCTILDNQVVDNSFGIELEASHNNTIGGNNVTDNDEGGMSLSDAKGNTVKDNEVAGNGRSAYYDPGIEFGGASGNNVTGNIFRSNGGPGLRFGLGCTDNVVYHNNFMEDYAVDWGSNSWNLTRPIGGNHWSDHTSPDNDGDGFVDIPYDVGDSNRDELPFTYENGWEFLGKKVHNLDTQEHFDSIQDAIDDGDTDSGDIIQVDAGNFTESVYVDKSVTIKSRAGSSNTIVQTDSGVCPVFRVCADNVTISGFGITGVSKLSGIWVEDSSGVLIEDNRVTGNRGGIRLDDSDNNEIKNNEVTSNEWQDGIWLSGSDGNIIHHNTISSNNGTGIYLMSNSEDNEVRDNHISSNYEGISLSESNNNAVRTNNVTENRWDGISLSQSNKNDLGSNTVTSNGDDGIELYHSHDNTIKANNISCNADDGVALEWCHGVRITNHGIVGAGEISFNEGDGISMKNSTGNSMWANIITSNGNETSSTGDGISLKNSADNQISWSTINSSVRAGISLDTSDRNSISPYDLTENHYGVLVYSPTGGISKGNEIDYNDISSNDYGIKLCNAEGNVIENNDVNSNTEYGIYVDTTNDNYIYHNNIEGNANQAYDSGSNAWDKGPYQGGNYWSNHTSPDNNGDGLVDVARNITGDANQDRYPFAAEDGWEGFKVASIRIDDCTVDKWAYDSGDTVKVTCKMANLGSGAANTTVKAELLDPLGEAQGSSEATNQTIEADSSKSIHLNVLLDSLAPPGSYTLNITAYKEDGTEHWDEVQTGHRFFVLFERGIKIISATPKNKRCFSSGENVTLTVSFNNSGNVDEQYKIVVELEHKDKVKTINTTGSLAAGAKKTEDLTLTMAGSDPKGAYYVNLKAYYKLGPEYRLSDSKTSQKPLQYKKFTYDVDIHDIFTQIEKNDVEIRISIWLFGQCGPTYEQIKQEDLAERKLKPDIWYCDYNVTSGWVNVSDVTQVFDTDITIETDKEAKCYYLKIVDVDDWGWDERCWEYNDYFWTVTNIGSTSNPDYKVQQGTDTHTAIGKEAIGAYRCQSGDGCVGGNHSLWGCIGGSAARAKQEWANWWCGGAPDRKYRVIFRIQVSTDCDDKTNIQLTTVPGTNSTSTSRPSDREKEANAELSSLADLHLYDCQGRHVGVNEEGGLDLQIPEVYYSGPDVEPEVMTIFGNIGDTTVFVEGQEEGTFDLKISKSTWMGERQMMYQDVPISAEAQARIDDTAEEDYTMHVDADGDGTFEGEREPDEEFLDSDSDGVADELDFCPNTPRGAEVDEYGCPFDSDGDGVCDGLDICPGYDDNIDSDGDGIPDGCDGPTLISNVDAWAKSSDSAIISWDTDKLSDSLVKYGTEPGVYNWQEYDASLVTYHEVTLTALELGTEYYFVVNSTDEGGDCGESREFWFIFAPPQPTIAFAPEGFNFSAAQGGANPADQILEVWNSGAATLNWTVSDDADWLNLDPTSGSSTGEHDAVNVTVSVDISEMSTGDYSATITISAPGATNSSETVPVNLEITGFDPWAYDKDDSGYIEIGELLQAINDYIGGEITISQLLEIINLYISHTPK